MNILDLLKQKIADNTPLENYFSFLRPEMTTQQVRGQMSTADRMGNEANVAYNQMSPANRPDSPHDYSPPVAPSPSPTPATHTPGAIPGGTDLAMHYIQAHTPGNASLEDYYPALGNGQFMDEVQGADQKRQGLANLLLLQSFFESTLGRGGHGYFGAKPGGKIANFNDPVSALHYQLGPSVLGGGANPNMNILGSYNPLTPGDVTNLYKSYDPPGAYLHELLGALATNS